MLHLLCSTDPKFSLYIATLKKSSPDFTIADYERKVDLYDKTAIVRARYVVTVKEVKQRVYPMLGFKRFENAVVTISGTELIHRIRKGQFNTSEIDVKECRTYELWQSVLAA
jgi:transposase-like protein